MLRHDISSFYHKLKKFTFAANNRERMNFRIGQRVRFLHETGEGVVTALIDRTHVEVDLGDDFPVEMHVSELIAIDETENRYLSVTKTEKPAPNKGSSSPARSGMAKDGIFSLSMAIGQEQDQQYTCMIINPTIAQAVYTCYLREKHKYSGQACGQVDAGQVQTLFTLDEARLRQIKAFYWQVLPFSPGKGHPHRLYTQEISWNKGRFAEKMRYIDALGKKAWVFSLTEQANEAERKLRIESEFARVKASDVVYKEEKIVDLHAESLADRPWEMAPSAILKLQLEALEKGLSDALSENYRSMIVIHGIGEGVLRKEVHKRLHQLPYVERFEQADLRRFGNGATKIYFK
ncbi:MAG: hypothetical protein D6730_25690 [Bacteroidetes bacterium]|nr:MAG: hypothetical protein D6730_25690 [Bacteroidota bacterium]